MSSPFLSEPQYTATKHGLVGLVRCCGPMMARENITVNCICPGFVDTNLTPPSMKVVWPKELYTPMEAIVNAFDMYLRDDKLTGQAMELSGKEHFFRQPVDFANEGQRQQHQEIGRILSKLLKENKGKL